MTCFVRDPSHHIKTPTCISTRRSTSKGGSRNRLLIAFLEESRMSTSSVSTGRLRSDLSSGAEASGSQKNKTTKEKGRGVISPNSRTSHPLHSHCTPMQLGTTADRSMTFLGTDFKKHAIWQGSIEKPAAKDFVARKVCTIERNEV